MESFIEEFQEEREKKSDLVITVDGPSGAGKGTIGKYIAEILGLNYYSAGQFFRQIAADRDMTVGELSQEADKETDKEVDRRTLQKGLEENCVIEGRLPSWVLGNYSDLKILLTADLEERSKRVAEREDISFEEAKERTEKRDKDNKQRYNDYYRINTDRKDIYDMLMDNTDISIKEEKKIIKETIEKEFPSEIK